MALVGGKDTTTGKVEDCKVTAGGLHMAQSGPDGVAITVGVSGTEYSGILDAPVAAATVTGASYVWTDATGCKGFTASQSLASLTADKPLAVAWSTTASDEAGIQATLAALITEYALTAGNHTGLFSSNVVIATIDSPIVQQFYDGTTTIKTIGAVALDGATVAEYVLTVVI